jgi:hypothetical protein
MLKTSRLLLDQSSGNYINHTLLCINVYDIRYIITSQMISSALLRCFDQKEHGVTWHVQDLRRSQEQYSATLKLKAAK